MQEQQPQRTFSPVKFSPYAEREILKAKDDYARAVKSGQFDEIQLEELWNKTDDYVGKLRRAGAEKVPERSQTTLQQEFDQNVLGVQGKLFQKDPQSGRFEVLSEPVKDGRQMEEMQFQQKLDTEKGRIDLMKQMMSLATGTADGGKKPMYSPEQVRQEVDRMLPSPQQGQQGQQAGISPEQFDQQWAQLPSGGTLTGPDGVMYRKK